VFVVIFVCVSVVIVCGVAGRFCCVGCCDVGARGSSTKMTTDTPNNYYTLWLWCCVVVVVVVFVVRFVVLCGVVWCWRLFFLYGSGVCGCL